MFFESFTQSHLFSAKIIGKFILVSIDCANKTLLKKLFGFWHLKRSITNIRLHFINELKPAVKIKEDADQEKAYICPGTSIMNTPFPFYNFYLTILISFYILALNKFKAVIIAPLGPSLN